MREERKQDGWSPSSDIKEPENLNNSPRLCSGCWNPGEIWTGEQYLCETHAKASGVIGHE